MSSEVRISIGILVLAVVVMSFSGCAAITGAETSYKPWVGDNIYKGQGGSVEVVNGVEIWEHGEPNKPYKVIGLITQSKSDDSVKKFLFGSYSQKQMTDMVVREKGDGVIVISSKRFVSGYKTHMPKDKSGTARTSADQSKESVIAVFRYVSSGERANHVPQSTQ